VWEQREAVWGMGTLGNGWNPSTNPGASEVEAPRLSGWPAPQDVQASGPGGSYGHARWTGRGEAACAPCRGCRPGSS